MSTFFTNLVIERDKNVKFGQMSDIQTRMKDNAKSEQINKLKDLILEQKLKIQ